MTTQIANAEALHVVENRISRHINGHRIEFFTQTDSPEAEMAEHAAIYGTHRHVHALACLLPQYRSWENKAWEGWDPMDAFEMFSDHTLN